MGWGVLEPKSPKVCVPKTAKSIFSFVKFHFFPTMKSRSEGGGVRPPPCVTFRLVVVPLRGPGRSPVLPFACCVGALRSVGRCDWCSCWWRFRVRGAPSLVCWGCAECGMVCRLRVSGAPHQGQTSREGEKDIWWTARTARGGTGHLGLTHTETQRGRLRTACGQRRVDSENSQTTPATTSTSSIRDSRLPAVRRP